MNAIETVRGLITDHAPDGYDQVDLGWTWGLRREGLDALAKLETLLQAAERVERNLGQEKADGGGERDAAYYSLAAAVRDVKGDTT